MGALRFPGSTQIVHWKEAGLLKPGVVKASIFTVDRALVEKRLGSLDAPDLENVGSAIQSILF